MDNYLGYCKCGCGQKTKISPYTDKSRGWFKGQPRDYCQGHHSRVKNPASARAVHKLSNVDRENRRANCEVCGEITIEPRRLKSQKIKWVCTRVLITQHWLNELDESTMTAHCRGCQKQVPVIRDTQGHPRCTVAIALLNLKRKLKKYGVDPHWYEKQLAEQGGICAICKKPSVDLLFIDHCHISGKVRKLLCPYCNKMLGFARDDPQTLRNGADYLEEHTI